MRFSALVSCLLSAVSAWAVNVADYPDLQAALDAHPGKVLTLPKSQTQVWLLAHWHSLLNLSLRIARSEYRHYPQNAQRYNHLNWKMRAQYKDYLRNYK